MVHVLILTLTLTPTLGAQDGALAWPDAAEFVRVAARYGALIVPLAGIGADE